MSDHLVSHPEALEEMAESFFGLPAEPLLYWPRIVDPDLAAGVTSKAAARRALGPGGNGSGQNGGRKGSGEAG